MFGFVVIFCLFVGGCFFVVVGLFVCFPNLLCECGRTLRIFPFLVGPVPAFRQLPLFLWVFRSLIL